VVSEGQAEEGQMSVGSQYQHVQVCVKLALVPGKVCFCWF